MTRRWRPVRTTLLATVAVVAGCDVGVASSTGEGVMLVPAPEGWSASGPAGEWTLVEDLWIGKDEADSTATFGQIADLAVDARGQVYVLDGMLKVVRVFGPDGRFIRTIGGEGSGPGHFRQPLAIETLPGDEIVVTDAGNARYEVFDANGRNVGAWRRTVVTLAYPWRGRILADRSVLEPEPEFDAAGLQVGLSVLHADSLGRHRKQFRVPYVPARHYTAGGEETRYRVRVPYSSATLFAIERSGERVVVASPTDYRLHILNIQGDTVREFGLLGERVRVTDRERRGAIRSIEELGLPRDAVDPSAIPDFKPAIAAFVLDDAGRVWVEPTQPDSVSVLDVFDERGCYLGRVASAVRISASVAPLIVGNTIYAVKYGNMGTQYVVRIRIEGTPARGC